MWGDGGGGGGDAQTSVYGAAGSEGHSADEYVHMYNTHAQIWGQIVEHWGAIGFGFRL